MECCSRIACSTCLTLSPPLECPQPGRGSFSAEGFWSEAKAPAPKHVAGVAGGVPAVMSLSLNISSEIARS